MTGKKSAKTKKAADIETPEHTPSGDTNTESRTSVRFPIVGIGASAGGLEALQEFFSTMPPDTGIAFVVVTHLHKGQPSMLPELLARQTTMPVSEADNGLRIEPNHVYVASPGGPFGVANGVFERPAIEDADSQVLVVDHCFPLSGRLGLPIRYPLEFEE